MGEEDGGKQPGQGGHPVSEEGEGAAAENQEAGVEESGADHTAGVHTPGGRGDHGAAWQKAEACNSQEVEVCSGVCQV